MTDKLTLDLPVLLPDALDGRDQCVDRLTATLRGAPGLEDVHVVDAAAGAPPRLCMHYDPTVTNVAGVSRSGVTTGNGERHHVARQRHGRARDRDRCRRLQRDSRVQPHRHRRRDALLRHDRRR